MADQQQSDSVIHDTEQANETIGPSTPSYTIPRKPLPQSAREHLDRSGEHVIGPHQDNANSLTRQGSTTSRDYQPLWRPIFLLRRVLVIFLAACLLFIASLEAIYRISEKNHGLVSSIQSRYYLWTYGPTAVLTLFAAFWARVEYRWRQMAPWHFMFMRETCASKSILLDYVGPLQPVAMCKSIRNKHYSVALACLVSLLLTLTIVISTGLLALTPVVTNYNNLAITVSDSFLDASLDISSSSYGSLPQAITYGTQNLNLSYPAGTTGVYAFQTIVSSDMAPQSMFEVTVDGFSIDFICEAGTIDKHQWTGIPSKGVLGINFDIVTDTCTIRNLNSSVPVDTETLLNETTPYTWFRAASCANMTGPEGDRILIAMGEMTSNPVVSADGSQTSAVANILWSFQRICKPSYTISEIQVTANITTQTSDNEVHVSPVPNSNNRTLPRVHASDFSQAFFGLLGSFMTGYEGNIPALAVGPDASTLFALMSRPNIGISELRKPGVLEGICRQTYRALNAQIAKKGIMKIEPSSRNGNVRTPESRLTVRLLPVRLMEALFAFISIDILTIILLSATTGIVPRDPASLSGLSAILSRQLEVKESLQGMASSNEKALNEGLGGNCYQTRSKKGQNELRYEIIETGQTALPPKNSSMTWWRPLPIRHFVIIGSCILVCLVIAALEVVLQLSGKRHGLADVNTTNYVHYVWSFVPAAVMTGIRLYFDALDFSCKVLAPYVKLKIGSTYRKSLSVNFLDKMALPALWLSIRTRSAAVFFAILATLLGTSLTIAVSGVYSADNVPLYQPASLHRQDMFGFGNDEYDATTQGTLIAGLITLADLQFPALTYEELAFPAMEIPAQSGDLTLATDVSFLETRLPAIRSELNCTVYNGIEALGAHLWPGPPPWLLYVSFPNSACDVGKSVATARVSPNATFAQTMGGTPSDCGDLEYFWGQAGAENITHITGLSCTETLGQLATDITLTVPDLAIDTGHPPVPDESTLTTFAVPKVAPQYPLFPTSPTPENVNFDEFFATLVRGRDGIPASFLASPDKNEQVIKAIIHLHRKVRAQQWNRGIRMPINRTSQSLFNATGISPNRLRLIQNSISTRVLEGLLAAMVVCAVVTAFLLDTKEVLPKCPCSIAAMASLLVNSDLLDMMPPDAAWMTDRVLEGFLGSHKYRMGWFRRDVGPNREVPGSEDRDGPTSEEQPEKANMVFGIYIDDDCQNEKGRVLAEDKMLEPKTFSTSA